MLGAAAIIPLGACGSSSDDVRIAVDVDEGGGPGSFSANGDAICADGVFTTVDFEFVEGGATFRDLYECSDGSGTFFLVGEVENELGQTTYTGIWDVEGGTGDYQDAEGSGTLTGETEPEWVVEYEGSFGTP